MKCRKCGRANVSLDRRAVRQMLIEFRAYAEEALPEYPRALGRLEAAVDNAIANLGGVCSLCAIEERSAIEAEAAKAVTP